jgi:hypothetical protein
MATAMVTAITKTKAPASKKPGGSAFSLKSNTDPPTTIQ